LPGFTGPMTGPKRNRAQARTGAETFAAFPGRTFGVKV
jgi:hypothetical protein